MKYDDNMDKECIALCNAINKIPGLRTIESCCGHGEREYRIWFVVEFPQFFPILLYYIDPCHVGFRWPVTVQTDCAMSPMTYCLQSIDKGKVAYKQAKIITTEINKFIKTELQRFKKERIL